jgi:hypothetical protein
MFDIYFDEVNLNDSFIIGCVIYFKDAYLILTIKYNCFIFVFCFLQLILVEINQKLQLIYLIYESNIDNFSWDVYNNWM